MIQDITSKQSAVPTSVVTDTNVAENAHAATEFQNKKATRKTEELYTLLTQKQKPDALFDNKKNFSANPNEGIDYLQTATNFKRVLSSMYPPTDGGEVKNNFVVLYRSRKNGMVQTSGQISFNCALPNDFLNELASIAPDSVKENKLILDINNDSETTKKIAQSIVVYVGTSKDPELLNRTLKMLNSRVI
jgi:hypothetical protein